MLHFPKISIVTPSFNQAQFIEETILSVINQNYPNLEYIIIDGGSTDGSVEIIRKYEKYLTYWVSEPDNGHGHALNKGFAKTTGEIMAWINSDDKYYPWTFSTVAEIFNHHADICWITGVPAFYDDKGRLNHVQKVYKNKFDYLIGNYKWIQQESTFWRRNLWNTSGAKINENYKLMVDGELWSRFFLHTELWHLGIILSGYRMHELNRASLNMEKIECEMDTIIAEMNNNINSETSLSLNKLSFYITEYEKKLAQKKRFESLSLLKILPHFIYFRIISCYKLKAQDIANLLKKDETFSYRILSFNNQKWEKSNLDFQIDDKTKYLI